MEDRSMATATKSKQATAEAAPPPTFAEINARKVRERIEAYREIVGRHAAGETLPVADMERAARFYCDLFGGRILRQNPAITEVINIIDDPFAVTNLN
jgi:hypothetical protein